MQAWFADACCGGPVLAVAHAGVIRTMPALMRGVSYVDVVAEPVLHLRVERLWRKEP